MNNSQVYLPFPEILIRTKYEILFGFFIMFIGIIFGIPFLFITSILYIICIIFIVYEYSNRQNSQIKNQIK